ncbi:testicular haploid expressed gene protein-like isoform X2 [Acanthaster planci]|uniref:Testicular haploid expressed gene protein-like isoform X2 n=1 Tax=Acanthaster planci TaxID=133434 RepID=A0A8B7XKX0_ACAPL|nr:testicular haploid expressed gene protein-like isoform X2 [Acanthaster planci]
MATMAEVQLIEDTSGNPYQDLRGRERCVYLATPKTSKAVWLTSLGRIHVYSCGRNSVIWDVSPLAMQAEATPRVMELSRFKMPPPAYREDRINHALSCGRESPIWQVSAAAKRARDKHSLEALARPKTPHRDYQPPREVETVVSDNAKKAVASPRLESLARPKSRPDGPFRDAKWPVSDLARNATATPRQLELAKPKGLVDGYQPERTVQWEVTRAARRTVATARTVDLSRPIMRATMDHVQFNPDAFIVSEAAKKGRCPPRIEELAQPITRS